MLLQKFLKGKKYFKKDCTEFTNEKVYFSDSDWGKDFDRNFFKDFINFKCINFYFLLKLLGIVKLFLACTYNHVHDILSLLDG